MGIVTYRVHASECPIMLVVAPSSKGIYPWLRWYLLNGYTLLLRFYQDPHILPIGPQFYRFKCAWKIPCSELILAAWAFSHHCPVGQLRGLSVEWMDVSFRDMFLSDHLTTTCIFSKTCRDEMWKLRIQDTKGPSIPYQGKPTSKGWADLRNPTFANPWTPKPWKMKVLDPQYMGYNP